MIIFDTIITDVVEPYVLDCPITIGVICANPVVHVVDVQSGKSEAILVGSYRRGVVHFTAFIWLLDDPSGIA